MILYYTDGEYGPAMMKAIVTIYYGMILEQIHSMINMVSFVM